MCTAGFGSAAPRNQKETDRRFERQQRTGAYDPATGEITGRARGPRIGGMGAKLYGEGIRFDQTTAGIAANTSTGAVAQAGAANPTLLGSPAGVESTAAQRRRRAPGASGGMTAGEDSMLAGQNTLLGG